MRAPVIAARAAWLAVAACTPRGGADCDQRVVPSDDDQAAVQEALLTVAPGGTVCLGEGTFAFGSELTLDVDDVTVRGAGQALTQLDFSSQDVGGNGLSITSDRVVIEDLTVLDTPGDGIRADQVDGVTFRRVTVGWSAPTSAENGAYGLYPVGSSDVVIDACTVYGARDAGIYVGQSRHILVADSVAEGNVAGIEIENSTDAEVRGNVARDNTAGILVFNLPGLPVLDGKRANVHDNVIEDNNLENFAEPGTVVSNVPPGVGMLVIASDANEIHANTVRGNLSLGIALLSYLQLVFGPYDDPDFDRYPEGNFVHDNTLEGNGSDPDVEVALLSGRDPVPELVWDGCVAEDYDPTDATTANCWSQPDASFTMLDFCGTFGGSSDDIAAFTCTHDPLPEYSP